MTNLTATVYNRAKLRHERAMRRARSLAASEFAEGVRVQVYDEQGTVIKLRGLVVQVERDEAKGWFYVNVFDPGISRIWT